MQSVTLKFPPSYCADCEAMTACGGWAIHTGGNVHMFCFECGKTKPNESFHINDLPMGTFKAEILSSLVELQK